MNCTTYWYNVFQSAALFMPVSVYATRSMLLVFILWFFSWAEMQFVQAGPLADAVEKAKVAAGVTKEIPVPELDVQEKGVRPALAPTAGSEPPQRVEVSTASVAVQQNMTLGSRWLANMKSYKARDYPNVLMVLFPSKHFQYNCPKFAWSCDM